LRKREPTVHNPVNLFYCGLGRILENFHAKLPFTTGYADIGHLVLGNMGNLSVCVNPNIKAKQNEPYSKASRKIQCPLGEIF
jgi:hypothetical protein